MFERFSDECKQALNIARRTVLDNRGAALDEVHILIGCCRTPESFAARVLVACGQDPEEICARAEVRSQQYGGPPQTSDQTPFTPDAKRVLELALEEASDSGHTWIGSHHLLIALYRLDRAMAEVLKLGGLQLASVRKAAMEVHQAETPVDERDRQPPVVPWEHRIVVLRAAQHVCVELHEFELASGLRDLIDKLEKGK